MDRAFVCQTRSPILACKWSKMVDEGLIYRFRVTVSSMTSEETLSLLRYYNLVFETQRYSSLPMDESFAVKNLEAIKSEPTILFMISS